MRRRVLLVDNDNTTQAALVHLVGGLGCDPVVVTNVGQALAQLRAGRIDLCLTDARVCDEAGRGDGYAILHEASERKPRVPVVMLMAQATVADAVRALREGAIDFLPKPFHMETVEEVLRRILEQADTVDQRGRRTPVAALIGENAAMTRMLKQVASVADTEASVLVRGETGTGKEVVARLLHTSSPRAAGPFVAVNMAAIPDTLAESELFGHVRGAFTGAERSRAGRFVMANHGTLFFDEIGEMSASLQAKLLRVLQDHEVTPVGGSERVPVDVRVVAATHRNLEQMVREGTFREDLFYRLEVVPIEVPPLRARRDDIPSLAEHFRREVNAREDRSVPGFEPAVVDRLMAHDWPGNVRELENLVERLVVVAANRPIALADLPSHMRMHLVDLERGRLDLPEQGVDLRMLLTQLEARLIGQALERTGGNRNRAAELLGMNRTTLVEKLRRRNVA